MNLQGIIFLRFSFMYICTFMHFKYSCLYFKYFNVSNINFQNIKKQHIYKR
jgi:hypothetical protein